MSDDRKLWNIAAVLTALHVAHPKADTDELYRLALEQMDLRIGELEELILEADRRQRIIESTGRATRLPPLRR